MELFFPPPNRVKGSVREKRGKKERRRPRSSPCVIVVIWFGSCRDAAGYEVRAWLRHSGEMEAFCWSMAEPEVSAGINTLPTLAPAASYKEHTCPKVFSRCTVVSYMYEWVCARPRAVLQHTAWPWLENKLFSDALLRYQGTLPWMAQMALLWMAQIFHYAHRSGRHTGYLFPHTHTHTWKIVSIVDKKKPIWFFKSEEKSLIS